VAGRPAAGVTEVEPVFIDLGNLQEARRYSAPAAGGAAGSSVSLPPTPSRAM
jgi:hypothetical protein